MKLKFIYIFSLIAILYCCKPGNFSPPYLVAIGYVVAQENCYPDSAKNSWIIDLSYPNQQDYYGDSISIHGESFLHAIRTFDLPDTFRRVGMAVGLFFNFTDSSRPLGDCMVDSPVTYKLKKAEIISAGFVAQ